ncbi:hypothetical protein V6N13_072808 [Hibiscus sabdariffa]|uniref:Uncharacterized protein n=1 Tax=Hibiscus sabdariffa TaxID=183260 RepID=A0ABR2EAS5_9ROSI
MPIFSKKLEYWGVNGNCSKNRSAFPSMAVSLIGQLRSFGNFWLPLQLFSSLHCRSCGDSLRKLSPVRLRLSYYRCACYVFLGHWPRFQCVTALSYWLVFAE